MDHIFKSVFFFLNTDATGLLRMSHSMYEVTRDKNRLDVGGSVFAGVGRPVSAACYMENPRLSWSGAPANRLANQIWHWLSNTHPAQIPPLFFSHKSGRAFVGESVHVHKTRDVNHSRTFGRGLQSLFIHRTWRALSKYFHQWVKGMIDWCFKYFI